MRLAKLCGEAVDFAKNGVPVDIHSRLPKLSTKLKPDWDKKEVTGAHQPGSYESRRALGEMFRSIRVRDPSKPIKGFPTTPPGLITPLEDPISRALFPSRPECTQHYGSGSGNDTGGGAARALRA